jgi:hypothetical protein
LTADAPHTSRFMDHTLPVLPIVSGPEREAHTHHVAAAAMH